MPPQTTPRPQPLHGPLLRGERKPRLALVGLPRTGKSTFFQAVASTEVCSGPLAGSTAHYPECLIEIGLEQATLIDLPSISSVHDNDADSQAVFKHLLWGDCWPAVASHDGEQPRSRLRAPDVLIQVIDATTLERNLELAQELSQLGRPLLIALNRLDEARQRGLYINVRALSEQLGVPVVPTVAHMGKGIPELFAAALRLAHERSCPLPQPPSPHLMTALQPLNSLLADSEIAAAFAMPRPALLMLTAADDDYFRQEMAMHFPDALARIDAARAEASTKLPRPLADELHADRHHRAARLFETVTRVGGQDDGWRWKHQLDQLFLHPRWGLLGSLGVFTLVLFMVFEVSSLLDSLSSAPLAAWLGEWTPTSTSGVIGRAVADGLVGLIGIVVPYMLPLVMLLVALEESGIMHRVAFVVDRGFHHIGLHGGVAVPFLLGLGCNVPAISAAATASTGRERIVAALLITFVPCSARSAIILAIGGKYLGVFGVLALFLLTLVVIGVAGRLLMHRYPIPGPGLIQEIPPYALPRWPTLLATTWERTSDILTIVTPLLIIGSVLLALLSHFGADHAVNSLLLPITHWLLGLPEALGVPILFGVLRKELSLVMIHQALGADDLSAVLNHVQIATFLVFMTFYIPCVSTFAVMLKLLGRREALFSVALSVSAALAIALVTRLLLTVLGWGG